MPLLKPPDPKIPTRKYYVRVEEPVARTMERYAEFLGTPSVDHVVTQALEFVFRKDTDFKKWLAQHPESAAGKTTATRKVKVPGKSTSNRVASDSNGNQEGAGL